MPTIVRAFDDEGSADKAVRDLDALNFDLSRVYKVDEAGQPVRWATTATGGDTVVPENVQTGAGSGVTRVDDTPVTPVVAVPAGADTGGGLGGGASGGIAGSASGGTVASWGLLS